LTFYQYFKEPIMKHLKTLSIPSILLAVAVLATGCHKTEKTTVETNGMGPAQTAGKAVDDAGANAAQATSEGAARTEAAARHAGDQISDAAARTDAAAREAGADARADAHEAGKDIKQGVSNATDATGRGLEHAGQKMQDASK
jgi:hypothetical protein